MFETGVRAMSPENWMLQVQNYPLEVILEILVKCSVFITVLTILSAMSMNTVTKPGPICYIWSQKWDKKI